MQLRKKKQFYLKIMCMCCALSAMHKESFFVARLSWLVRTAHTVIDIEMLLDSTNSTRGWQQSTPCNRLPKFPDFRLQYFTHSSVSTNPSQGIYRGIESLSALSVTLYYLKSRNLHARSMSVPPCQRNKPPAGKTHVTISPGTNKHLRTAGHSYKQENSNLIWKRGVSDLYLNTLSGASVENIHRF